MNKQTQAGSSDVGTLAEDARALVTATVDVAGEKAEEAREKFAAALESGKEVYTQVCKKAFKVVKAADQTVRGNPYQAVGIALGVGAILAYLVTRRFSRHD